MLHKFLLVLILLVFLCVQANAQYVNVSGWAERGGMVIKTSPTVSYKVQESYPSSTVTVYLTGTTTLAPIFTSTSGGIKANPFTASSVGYWSFYIAPGRYDVKFSGAGITTPFTISDITVGIGGEGGEGVENLTDLVDVDISAPVNRNFLIYNGTIWSNRSIQQADLPTNIITGDGTGASSYIPFHSSTYGLTANANLNYTDSIFSSPNLSISTAAKFGNSSTFNNSYFEGDTNTNSAIYAERTFAGGLTVHTKHDTAWFGLDITGNVDSGTPTTEVQAIHAASRIASTHTLGNQGWLIGGQFQTVNEGVGTVANAFAASFNSAHKTAGIVTNLGAGSFVTNHQGGGIVASLFNLAGTINITNSSDVTTLVHYNADNNASGSGINVTTGTGFNSALNVANSASITTWYNFRATRPTTSASGTINTLYGFYSNDVAAISGVTNAWQFYGAGASSKSRLEGALYIDTNLGVGTQTPRKLVDLLSNSSSQLRLSYTDNSVYSDFTVGSGGTLTIAPTGDIEIAAAGKDVLPVLNYDQNLGALSKKYLTLHAAELWVETLVAQSTLATIGGRILVGATTPLIADLSPSATSIDTKHNNLGNSDRVYLEANGQVEFLAITSTCTVITGGCRYTVTRNLDGSGANQWYAGDAVFNTGQAGSGFIDLYSVRGVKSSSQAGPSIVGNVRNSPTYNDWSEVWAIGNLNGLYGYGVTTFGAAFGKYAAGTPHVTIDSINGYRTFSGLSTVVQQIDNSGNITVGQVAAGQSNVYITAGSLAIRVNAADRIKLNSDGSGFLASNNISWDTSGNALIAGFSINSNSITKNEVKIAAGADITDSAGVGEAWFGKSSTAYYGVFLKGTTAARMAMIAGNPGVGSSGRPYMYQHDGTRYRTVIGELNVAWGSDGASNSMGMKMWDSSGNKLVEFSDIRNMIAGWGITATTINNGVVTLDSVNGINIGITQGGSGLTSGTAVRWTNSGFDHGVLYVDKASATNTNGYYNVITNSATGNATLGLWTQNDGGTQVASINLVTVAATPSNYITMNGTGTFSGVTIGSSSPPTTSSILDLNSITGALLIPRLTTVQRDALTATNGMLIYNSTTGKFQGRAGGAWIDLH